MTIGGCRCSCSSCCGIQLRVVAYRNRYFDKEMLIIIVACKIENERGRVRERERERKEKRERVYAWEIELVRVGRCFRRDVC